jgi:hypothetical protein
LENNALKETKSKQVLSEVNRVSSGSNLSVRLLQLQMEVVLAVAVKERRKSKEFSGTAVSSTWANLGCSMGFIFHGCSTVPKLTHHNKCPFIPTNHHLFACLNMSFYRRSSQPTRSNAWGKCRIAKITHGMAPFNLQKKAVEVCQGSSFMFKTSMRKPFSCSAT